MPIRALLRDGHFTPEDIAILTAAFEDTLRQLKLVDRTDPAATLVAKRIIAVARQGERSPAALREAVLKAFRDDPGFSGL